MLYNQQEAAHNHIEAGYTLLAHIDLLEWSDKIVKPFSLMTIKFPEEKQRDRKVFFNALGSNSCRSDSTEWLLIYLKEDVAGRRVWSSSKNSKSSVKPTMTGLNSSDCWNLKPLCRIT